MPKQPTPQDRNEKRFEQIAHNFEAVHDSIKRLENVVGALAESVVAHDNQIEKLTANVEKQGRRMDQLMELSDKQGRRMDQIVQKWQAYLATLPKR